ncbi:Serine/threonine-protein kinase Nek4 [Schistosoma japonicum]|nr:Serine/threonine-protein kinase Nek4 [Schistosoma japonicum]
MVSDFSNTEISEYQFLKTIGKGSYGEVWLCKNKVDAKKYVIKKIDVTKSSEKERKAAKLECKLLSEFKHPNIVQYKASFEYHGFLYIAMGFCEGGDLYTRLRMRNGVFLSERVVVEWFVQLAIALQYMHERNVLHRDLKTRNIFLTRTNIVKLGDLGIARVLESSSSMATTLIGTPYYMSPELYANKPYNHKSDIWALGCVLYEMSTLRHAFNAKTFNALSYKILSGKVPDMPTHYSPELLELMREMLHIKPEKRPSARRVLTNSFIRKHIILFLETTKDRTNSFWDRSTNGDEVQNTNKCKNFDERAHIKPASVAKMVTDEKASQMEQKSVKTFSGQVYDKNSESIMKETLSSNENDRKPKSEQENKSKVNHLISNASNELNRSMKRSLNTSVKLPSGQYETQINRQSSANCFEQLEDNSLLRRLSDARLRRRQRRRMSEVNEEQHSNQQYKHEHQQEQTKSFNLTKSNDNNNSKLKLHKRSKIHLHSFSILPVSMLPKLHKRINPVENNSIIDNVIKENLSNEVNKFNGVRELSINQPNCIVTSTSVVKSSLISDADHIEKVMYVFLSY